MRKRCIGKKAAAVVLSVGLAGTSVLSSIPAYGEEQEVSQNHDGTEDDTPSGNGNDANGGDSAGGGLEMGDGTENEGTTENESGTEDGSENDNKEENQSQDGGTESNGDADLADETADIDGSQGEDSAGDESGEDINSDDISGGAAFEDSEAEEGSKAEEKTGDEAEDEPSGTDTAECEAGENSEAENKNRNEAAEETTISEKDAATDEEKDLEKAAAETLRKLLMKLPDVSELDGMMDDELDTVQELLDEITFYMEEYGLEATEAQVEQLTEVADWLNQSMIQILADDTGLSGECGAQDSEVFWKLTPETGGDTYTLTISGTGQMESCNPSTDLENLAAVGQYPWQSKSSKITKIVIEDGVTSIGAKAFIAYTNVKEVVIGKDVEEIGTAAFNQMVSCAEFQLSDENEFFTLDDQGALYDAGMRKLYALPCKSATTEYVLPDSVEVIGYNAFARCSKLVSVEISPDSSLTTLGYGAFAFTESLESLKMLPETVTAAGDSLFLSSGINNIYCTDAAVKELLTSRENILGKAGLRVLQEEESPMEEYVDAEGYVWYLNYPETGKAYLKSAPVAQAVDVVIPEEIQKSGESYTVTEIGPGAFAVTTDLKKSEQGEQNKQLKSVVIPYTVTKIGEKAFYFCVDLQSIVVESSAITIGTGAFNTYASGYGEDKNCTVLDISAVRNLTDIGTSNVMNGTTLIIGQEEILDVLNCGDQTKAVLKGNTSYYWIRVGGKWEKSAAEGTAKANGITWHYKLNDDGITLTGYDEKTTTAIEVPAYLTIEGKLHRVVKLDTALFGTSASWENNGVANTKNTHVQTVIIPDTVITTGQDVFRCSEKLTTVSFRSSQLELNGHRTFSGTALQMLDLSSVETLKGLETWNAKTTFSSVGHNINLYVNSADSEQAIQRISLKNNIITYLVTNGGTIDVTDSTTFSNGLYTPSRSGYVFDGWYTSADFSGTSLSGSPVNESTYYAKWTETAAENRYTMDTSPVVLESLRNGYSDEEALAGQVTRELLNQKNESVSIKSISTDSNSFVVELNSADSGKLHIRAASGLGIGTYSGTVTVEAPDGTKFRIPVSVSVERDDTVITAGTDGNHVHAVFGDNITLTAKLFKKPQTREISTFAAMPALEDSVDFYCGETLLGTAMVKYGADLTSGTVKLVYDTGRKGIPAGSVQTITARYGGNGQLAPVQADIMQVELEKAETRLYVTADKTQMTGAGTVTLTIDRSELPFGADYTVSCDMNAISMEEKAEDMFEAKLPDLDQVYTFTVSYAGDAFYEMAEDSCTVSVKKTPSQAENPIQKPDPAPEPTPDHKSDPTPSGDEISKAEERYDQDSDDSSDSAANSTVTYTGSEQVTDGKWSVKADGSWDFRKTDGIAPAGEWLFCMWNGKPSWYRFDEKGDLKGGWYTAEDGAVYYLHDVHDGNYGAMYTGWNKIQDKWYYFAETEANGHKQGAMIRNDWTPDGHFVDENGVCAAYSAE